MLKQAKLPAQIGELVLEEELGRGHHSIVLGARAASGARYAVKLSLQLLDDDPSVGASFTREAALLAQIDHSALPRVFDSGVAEGRAYIVVERLEGDTLAERIARATLSETETRRLAAELCRAMASLHTRGLVHRDVKPENVLLEPSGRVRLLDLGLAIDVRRGAGEAAPAGTLTCCAPEQLGLLDRPVDGRADLYALAGVIFHALAGRPPFTGTSASELLHAHASERPPRLDDVVEVSSALADLVERLLAKDPADRPASAAEVLAALHASDDDGQASGSDAGQDDERARDAPRRAVVGRAELLREIDEAIASARGGSGAIVSLEGPAGCGKSHLAQELRARARDAGVRVLEAAAAAGSAVPFATMRALVDNLLDDVEGKPAEAEAVRRTLTLAAGRLAPVLANLSPRLPRVLGVQAGSGLEDAREKLLDVLARALSELARESGGLVLVLDDAQWLDRGTSALLRRLGARLHELPLLLVLATRSDAGSEASSEALEALSEGRLLRLPVGVLAEADVAVLVRELLGGRSVDPRVADVVARRCDGVPLAIETYLRALVDEGVLRYRWGSWTLDDSELERVSLPKDVEELILRRLASLPDDTAAALEAAAVLGSSFSAARVQALVGDAVDVNAALEDAAARGLCEQLAARYRFLHERLRDGLLARLPAARRRLLHQSAARALAQEHHDDDDATFARAWHLQHGVDEQHAEEAYRAHTLAGEEALRREAADDALRLFETARALAQRFSLVEDPFARVLQGRAALRTHRVTEAVEHLEASLATLPDRAERARTLGLLAACAMSSRDSGAAARHLDRAIAELGYWMPASRLLGVLSIAFYGLCALFATLTAGLRGPAQGDERRRLVVLCEICTVGGYVAHFEMRTLRLVQQGTAGLYAGCRLVRCAETADAYCHFAVVLGVMGLTGLGVRVGSAAEKMADDLGARVIRARASAYAAWTELFGGRELHGIAKLERTLASLGDWLDPADSENATASWVTCELLRGYPHLDVVRASIAGAEERAAFGESAAKGGLQFPPLIGQLAQLGQIDEAERTAAACARIEGFFQSPYRLGEFIEWNAMLALERGSTPEELRDLERRFAELCPSPALAEFHLKPCYIFTSLAWLDLVESDRSGAERDDVERGFRHARKRLRQAANRPLQQVYLHIVEAAAARHARRYRRADRELEKASVIAERLDAPWPRSLILIERARLLRAQNEADLAAPKLLASAAAIAREQGFTRRAARIESLLGRRVRALQSSAGDASGTPSSSSHVSSVAALLSEQLMSLLELSQAVAEVLDPDRVVEMTLRETVRIFNADRALLFLLEDPGGQRSDTEPQLRYAGGFDGRLRPIDAADDYSRTVTERALSGQRGVVLQGADTVEIESVVLKGLRSVIAAPLYLRERILGVIYLDSTLARGLFNQSHLQLLQAFASQIAIAFETARAAKLEVERSELAKDLALTGLVQSHLLPESDQLESEHFSTAAVYLPVSSSGGDWWWCEDLDEGKLAVYVGDVTGHGAGAAMMTAVLAGSFQAVARGGTPDDVEAALRQVNAVFSSVARERYGATLAAALFDNSGQKATLLSAGAPPFLIARANGTLEVISLSSTPLGIGAFTIERKEVHLERGDRLLIFTDGFVEAETTKKRPYGLRRTAKLLTSHLALDPADALAAMLKQHEEHVPAAARDDDITLVLVAVR